MWQQRPSHERPELGCRGGGLKGGRGNNIDTGRRAGGGGCDNLSYDLGIGSALGASSFSKGGLSTRVVGVGCMGVGNLTMHDVSLGPHNMEGGRGDGLVTRAFNGSNDVLIPSRLGTTLDTIDNNGDISFLVGGDGDHGAGRGIELSSMTAAHVGRTD
jgi:hypothetical protein